MLHIDAQHTEILACMKKTLDSAGEMCDNRFMIVGGKHIDITSYCDCDDGQHYHVVVISEIQDVSNVYHVQECEWELEPQDYYFFANDLPSANEFFIKKITDELRTFDNHLNRVPATRIDKVAL